MIVTDGISMFGPEVYNMSSWLSLMTTSKPRNHSATATSQPVSEYPMIVIVLSSFRDIFNNATNAFAIDAGLEQPRADFVIIPNRLKAPKRSSSPPRDIKTSARSGNWEVECVPEQTSRRFLHSE